jgi:glycosyltransferase involved in cell wall biosynthesis
LSRRIAVLVAARNAEKTIRSAVESVLTGSHPCRVFVVDDASHVPVANVLGSYAGRVEIIRLERNVGPAGARNVAIERALADGFDYIAIQNADDLSYADRLATQVAFLEAHPAVGAVGSHARDIDAHTSATIRFRTPPTAPAGIHAMKRFDTGILPESAMFRASALRDVGLHCRAHDVEEGAELLRRVATRFELATVPEYLLACRVPSPPLPHGGLQHFQQPHLSALH